MCCVGVVGGGLLSAKQSAPVSRRQAFTRGDPKMRKGLLFAQRTPFREKDFIFAKRTFIMAKTFY